MGDERRKRARAALQKYNLITKIIAAFALAGVGISGCIAFVQVYHNYNAGCGLVCPLLLPFFSYTCILLFVGIMKEPFQG